MIKLLDRLLVAMFVIAACLYAGGLALVL